MDQSDFGYLLRELRYERGETLEQVSADTGLSVAMLSRIERGERLPSPESVQALAQHFDLPVEVLMSETIMHRMLSRYGRKSSNLAAERLRSLPDEPDEDQHALGEAAGAWEVDPSSLRGVRHYALFRERPVLEALREIPQHAKAAPLPDDFRLYLSAPTLQDHSETPEIPDTAPRRGLEPDIPAPATAPAPAAPAPAPPHLDPAVERFLEATEGSLDAAAMLALREIPRLPSALRLELVERIAGLAEHPVGVLRALARDDGDERVRQAARRALERLTRRR